ncbi:hypothetical protein PBRA_005761 [Plasmodiophora brassicae]|uniref:Raptor N-terminal CASPase-like domain-containing protein n=1 Tax=Plasmodiophora brassicae TaxID=37360 RepID=A0A0G4IPL6_PLABS|nr:hypothetical protein PBRA_005761 [Plasmodiophora brassicae]
MDGDAGARDDDAEEVEVFADRGHLYAAGIVDRRAPNRTEWRMRGRMRTVSVALVMCLNIGVDPPDVIRAQPCARLECWVDPLTLPAQKALSTIGNRLQNQYERWQPRARYVQSLDQTVEDVRKLCISLRRSSKHERILFHYNGHGVPRPTTNGEIWVFNKNYTQYIPLSIFDLHSWLSSPSIYVFDCSAAGIIASAFAQIAAQQRDESGPSSTDIILLAACSANDVLPMGSGLGVADVFTSCLTTPIRMALRWFVTRSGTFLRNITPDDIDMLPGKPNDRKSPCGELNWIFTAVTDTIAWNTLPCALFQRMFRQDLLVASLFRNYLLAERIMRSLRCTPVSLPPLPSTCLHPMWNAWDFAAEAALAQLEKYVADPDNVTFQPSSFFTEQLTAFEVWLEFGSESKRPMELPVVLQVLLSQAHRLRALQLLATFIDLGPWAVNLALSVGIFPYVLKLLQSPTTELRHVLIFIWTKIIAFDQSCQRELVKDQYHLYFLKHISPTSSPVFLQRLMSLFVVSGICDRFSQGQHAILTAGGLGALAGCMTDTTPLTRVLVLVCCAKLWERYEPAREAALRQLVTPHSPLNVVDYVVSIAQQDGVPQVRAAAAYALGTFIVTSTETNATTRAPAEGNKTALLHLGIVRRLCTLATDGSGLVRAELVHTIHALIGGQREAFADIAAMIPYADMTRPFPDENVSSNVLNESRVFIWKIVLMLCRDPLPRVAQIALTLHKLLCPYRLVRSASGQAINASAAHDAPEHGASIPRIKSDSSFLHMHEPASTTIEHRSTFYDFTCDLFSRGSEGGLGPSFDDERWIERQEQPPDADQQIMIQEARYQKANQTDQEALHRNYEDIAERRLSGELALLTSPFEQTTKLIMHPYEPLVVSADPTRLAVFNYETSQLLNTITNGNTRGSAITSLQWLNPKHVSLVAVGSDDGVVRVWRNCHDAAGKVAIISAWTAVPGMKRGAIPGLVLDWQQQQMRLLCAGNSNVIKVWDTSREFLTADMVVSDTKTLAITSVCADNDLVFTGGSDNRVRMCDLRAPSSPAQELCTHDGWVVSVRAQQHTIAPMLVSASVRGDVRVSDLRKPTEPVSIFQAHHSGSKSEPLNTFAISDVAPLYAAGSVKQFVNIGTLSGTPMNALRYQDGFLGQRIGPVNCVAFHPRALLLAVGCGDRTISIVNDRDDDHHNHPVIVQR